MQKVIVCLTLLGCSLVAADITFKLGTNFFKGESYHSFIGSFTFQGDGNAVIYNQLRIPLWQTNTPGRGYILKFQTDGNLVVYDSKNTALWQSQTYGKGANRLVFQDDRNLVIYSNDNRALWSSGTHANGWSG